MIELSDVRQRFIWSGVGTEIEVGSYEKCQETFAREIHTTVTISYAFSRAAIMPLISGLIMYNFCERYFRKCS